MSQRPDTPDDDARLEAAAERGARRALERVGLHDEHAGKDIAELRSLLEAFRDTKTTVRRALMKWITVAFLTAIAAAAGFRFSS
jgi:hypothetical protein